MGGHHNTELGKALQTVFVTTHSLMVSIQSLRLVIEDDTDSINFGTVSTLGSTPVRNGDNHIKCLIVLTLWAHPASRSHSGSSFRTVTGRLMASRSSGFD